MLDPAILKFVMFFVVGTLIGIYYAKVRHKICRIPFFHDWETEHFGGGFPMRECRRCGRCEVKPIGSSLWHETGKGVTLGFNRQLYAIFERQKELSELSQANKITFPQYIDGMDELDRQLAKIEVRD